MNKISTFFGKNRFLSNFWPAEIVWDSIVFPTVEHAYQAAKSTSRPVRIAVSRFDMKPAAVKAVGKINQDTHRGPEFEYQGQIYQIALRDDWTDINLQLMYELNKLKYTLHKDLYDKLMATGDAILEEGNTWHDTFWGICPPDSGKGENHLGIILMRLREDLRK